MFKLRVKYQAESTAIYFTSDSGLNEREKIGVWLGTGCNYFGVDAGSPVLSAHLTDGLNGKDLNGRRLFQRDTKDRRRCAWDSVFAPDKSISVAALCLDDPAANLIRDEFDQVATPLVRWMERMTARSDYYSSRAVPTDNLTTARFTHESSRHNDPHLHLHLLFLNATWDLAEKRYSNRWRAVDPAHIYRAHTCLDHLANRELARRLDTAGISVELRDGNCVLPVPRALCNRLSKAHAEIVRLTGELTPPSMRSDLLPMSAQKWADYCNDRFRPPKTPVEKRGDFRRLVDDRAELTERLRRPASAPSSINEDAPKPGRLAELVERELYKNSLLWSTKDRWIAATRVALDYPHASLDSILQAALSVKKEAPFFPAGSADPLKAAQDAEFTRLFQSPRRAKSTPTPQIAPPVTPEDTTENEAQRP